MQTYWLKFDDGTTGYCEGSSAYDAVMIAEHITKKKVDVGDHRYRPEESGSVKPNPYPTSKMIWQFEHPVYGKCPGFCFGGAKCIGRSACPQSYACSE